MKGLPIVVVTVTTRVRLFAVVVAPTGMKSPSSGDLFAGLPTKSRFFLTTVAVSAVPSAQRMFRCSLNVTFFGETTFHDCARPDTILPGPARFTSVSYENVSTNRAADTIVSCGSRLPGSVPTLMLTEPEGVPAAWDEEPSGRTPARIAEAVPSTRTAATAITRTNRLRISDPPVDSYRAETVTFRRRKKFGPAPARRLRGRGQETGTALVAADEIT